MLEDTPGGAPGVRFSSEAVIAEVLVWVESNIIPFVWQCCTAKGAGRRMELENWKGLDRVGSGQVSNGAETAGTLVIYLIWVMKDRDHPSGMHLHRQRSARAAPSALGALRQHVPQHYCMGRHTAGPVGLCRILPYQCCRTRVRTPLFVPRLRARGWCG